MSEKLDNALSWLSKVAAAVAIVAEAGKKVVALLKD